jgi:outer membrane scaffolding protein for murein synthesis (MipA/OmpV family)
MKRILLSSAVGLTAALVFVIILTGLCFAQDIEMPTGGVVEEVPETKGIYEIGLGAGVVPEYEGSENSTFVALPYVSLNFANHMSLEWIANTLKANLIPSRTFKFGPIGQYIRERGQVDNRKVDNLENVDASFMLGGFFGLEVNRFMAGIEA